jgi:hypothetical protein
MRRSVGAVSVTRAAFRRGGAPALALLAVVALIAAAVALGLHPPDHGLLPGLRHNDSGGYSRDALGSIAPVSAAFVEGRIGKSALERLTVSPEPAPPAEAPRTPPRSGTTPSDQSIHGSPGPVPGLAPGGWVLALDMVADQNSVRAGDEVAYRITVRNVGGEDFRGRGFTLEWHTPLGTVGRNPLTQCNLLPVTAARALCQSQRLAVSPGAGEARHEQMNSAGLIAIPAGGKWVQTWYVQVLPGTPAGTQYTNHAHLHVNVDNQDRVITTPPVIVTVVA